MKKQLNYAAPKKVFTILVALVVYLSSSVSSYALPIGSGISKSAEITYKGQKDKFLVFNVDYKNESDESFNLVIKNDQNDVLYNKKFEAKPLNTEVYLSEVPENCKLTFSIVSGKKVYTQAFEIDTQVKTVENLVVKGI